MSDPWDFSDTTSTLTNLHDFGMGEPGPSDEVLTPMSPPVVWAASAAALAMIGGLVGGLLGERLWIALVGWAVCGPVAFTLLAVFNRIDTARRSYPVYSSESWVKTLVYGAYALAFLGVLVNAVQIALWFGRR